MKTFGFDISVLNHKQKTGIGVYVYELLSNILKVNKQDKFILFAFSTLDNAEYFQNLPFMKNPNVKLKIVKVPSKSFRILFALWQKFNWPKIEFFTGKLDLFHSFNWYFPPTQNTKNIATIFDMTPIIFPQLHQEKTLLLDKLRFKRIADKADQIIAISDCSKKDYLKYYPGKQVEVINPASSEKFFKKINLKKQITVLKKFNLQKGYFLSVCTLEPRKNLEKLITAYLKTNLDNKLVLVGTKGWKNDQLMDLISKYPQKIIVTGFITDQELAVLYKNALCFIYPSLYEGFGIPVLEALSSNIPVITSNVSSLPEVGGDAVLYINPQKEVEIKDALLRISKDEKLRKELIKKGKVQARKFSWVKSAKQLNNIYQNI